MVSDNGPQYSALAYEEFAKEYGFNHTTSSPKYPQANGTAEWAVKTVKQLLLKNQDPYLAMLTYRATPLENGYSPTELLMGRNLRTTLPQTTKQTPYHREAQRKGDRIKRKFDKHNGVKDLKPLSSGDTVWILKHEAGMWNGHERVICGTDRQWYP